MASSPRVLVVDDDPSILRLAQFNLEADGFEVTLANDGQEGLDVFLAGRYDVLLLDLMMPRLDGFELLERVRATEAGASVPVFMLTARATPEDMARAKEFGVAGYLRKPFDPAELGTALRDGLAAG